jgi:hypothetical protein
MSHRFSGAQALPAATARVLTRSSLEGCFSGGDVTSDVRNIHCRHWGWKRATGYGRGWYTPPGKFTFQSVRVTMELRATHLGTCRGRLAYKRIGYYYKWQGSFHFGSTWGICGHLHSAQHFSNSADLAFASAARLHRCGKYKGYTSLRQRGTTCRTARKVAAKEWVWPHGIGTTHFYGFTCHGREGSYELKFKCTRGAARIWWEEPPA